jgi:hypothetical protein
MKAAMRRRNVIEKSLCFILSIGFFALIYGCDEEPEPKVDLRLPEVVSTDPSQGAEDVPGNAMITFTLNKPLAEAQVSGAAGTTSVVGKVVTLIPSPAFADGLVTLTLTGTDRYGQELEEFTLQFTVIPLYVYPEIEGYECKPKDGESNVDPNDYPEKLVIAFNEALSRARIVSTKPEFPYTTKLSEDGMSLEISFVDYTMPYETKFAIALDATDLGGNTVSLEYFFMTMVKR